jgi:hypothetical protein
MKIAANMVAQWKTPTFFPEPQSKSRGECSYRRLLISMIVISKKSAYMGSSGERIEQDGKLEP